MTRLQPAMFDLVSKPEGPASMKEKVDTRERLQDELLNYDGPVRQAIRNFIGVLLFYMDGAQKALECFQEVLTVDPDNINALQNCSYVYNKLMKDSDVKRLETKLRHLLADSDSSKTKQLKARFHAEQGYVMSFEFTFDRTCEIVDFDRFRTATGYFEKALGLDFSDIFSAEESCQWQFFAARTYHRFYDRYLRVKSRLDPVGRDNILIRAIGLFHYVILNSESDTYKSRAWCLLGTLMFKMPRDWKGTPIHTQQLASCIHECGFYRHYRSPDLCFEKACELCPRDAKLLCRYSRMFMSQHFKDLPRAIKLLDKSVEMDNSKSNWLAFSSRGQSRKRLYEEQGRIYKSSTRKHFPATPPDRNLLTLAEADLEHSQELKPLIRERIELGLVCHLLGKPSNVYNQVMDVKMMDKALCHFSQAVESLEGRKHSLLHLKRGHCLKDYGEIRSAIESYKTSMECEEKPTPHLFNEAFGELMMLLLHTCREENLPQELVSEVAFWFDCSFSKQHESINSSVRRCCRDFTHEMLVVCRELFKVRAYGVARFVLPTLITALDDILWRCRRDGKFKKVPVVERDFRAAKEMQEHLQARKSQSDRAVKCGPAELATALSDLSLSPSEGEALSTQGASVTDPPVASQAVEQLIDFKDRIGHPMETARNTMNKKYDFFVLYSDEDREWVLYSLVPKLETHYNLKGFIRDRDILYGEEETGEVIGHIVENSICTIAVLSEAFLQDKWRRKHLTWVFSETEEDDHPILLVKLAECKITKAITRMSQSPVIDFFDWHKLVTSLKDLGKC